jgi:glycerophosphoryl diester phosphodiesterase
VTAVFAHRGCTDGPLENTVEAFAEARRRGADGVELDVRRTADGALVVHHDAVVAGVGTLCELEVRELPAHVPLLADALAACDGLVVNVEIKNSPGDPGYEADLGIADAVAGSLNDLGWSGAVVVSSFDRETLSAALAADPRLATGLLLGSGAHAGPALEEAASLGFSAIHPFVSAVTGDLVAQAHGAGLAVNTWTVNHPDDLRRMADLGVDAVITDRLDEALAIVHGGE